MAGIVGRGWEGMGLQVRSAVVQGLGQKETEGGRWIPAAGRGAGPWRWEGWHPKALFLVLISRAAKDGPGQQAVGLLSS